MTTDTEEALRKANEELEQRVQLRTRQLRDLAAELALAEERQKRAIATDLHDQLGQTLAMVKLRLQEIRGEQVFGGLYHQLGGITELIDQAIRFTRTLTVELSPPILHELGLEAALQWLAAEIKQKYGFKVSVQRSKRPFELGPDVRSALFRFSSELLTNVAKHARATYVIVALAVVPGAAGNELEISVSDNGCGFEPARLQEARQDLKGFGLFSVKERIEHFGGTFKLESRPGAGTRVVLRLPLG